MNWHIVFCQESLLRRFLGDSKYCLEASLSPLHSYLGKWLPREPGAKLIELGCGPGKYVALLSNLGYNVVGVDPFAFPSWKLIKERFHTQLLHGIRAESLPFKDRAFDHGVCLGALLYFDDAEKGLSELVRVIRPGGTVILRTVNRDNLYTERTGLNIDPASKHLYTMKELRDLMQRAGLKVRESLSFGFFPPFWTSFWWYLTCCWVPNNLQLFLSKQLPERSRVNHIVLAEVSPP